MYSSIVTYNTYPALWARRGKDRKERCWKVKNHDIILPKCQVLPAHVYMYPCYRGELGEAGRGKSRERRPKFKVKTGPSRPEHGAGATCAADRAYIFLHNFGHVNEDETFLVFGVITVSPQQPLLSSLTHSSAHTRARKNNQPPKALSFCTSVQFKKRRVSVCARQCDATPKNKTKRAGFSLICHEARPVCCLT